MTLIDTHCHLSLQPLAGDLGPVLQRALDAGVEHVVAPAYDGDCWDALVALSRHSRVSVALGLHPWAAAGRLDLGRLRRLLRRSGAVALGEIGLDFAVQGVDRRRQVEVFTAQLELARELDLPVILHCRKAFDALLALLHEHGPLRGVLHGFSRAPELALRLVDEAGLHVGFGPRVTRRGARRARTSVAAVPLDRLLLETDGPGPLALTGKQPAVEPSHLPAVAAAVAELRAETPEHIAQESRDNARALFKLA